MSLCICFQKSQLKIKFKRKKTLTFKLSFQVFFEPHLSSVYTNNTRHSVQWNKTEEKRKISLFPAYFSNLVISQHRRWWWLIIDTGLCRLLPSSSSERISIREFNQRRSKMPPKRSQKTIPTFSRGDLVYAKVKGYPPYPAIVSFTAWTLRFQKFLKI